VAAPQKRQNRSGVSTPAAAPKPSIFDVAVASVLASEGSYSLDPVDPGGETALGVTQATLERAQQLAIVPHGIALRDLTPDQARTIYRSLFWLPAGCDQLPAALALSTFDAAVNLGVSAAVALLQAALGVRVDGKVGPQTIATARRAAKDGAALDRLLAARAERYVDLVAGRPGLRRYRSGWLIRCFRVARQAATLSGEDIA
jgi:lysozyme family protein